MDFTAAKDKNYETNVAFTWKNDATTQFGGDLKCIFMIGSYNCHLGWIRNYPIAFQVGILKINQQMNEILKKK